MKQKSSRTLNQLRALHQLEQLKKKAGPFTSCSEVEKYLADTDVTEKMKKTRMKTEVQYAKDSCISLPKTNPVFRIWKRRAKGDKLQDLTPQEFGENLEIFISKMVSALKKSVTIANFLFVMDLL